MTGRLINIDNGGTLTDICVIDEGRVFRTKTLTTPHDLSQCLFDGLKKASRAVLGEEDLQGLLLSTESIRYSTTRGTNALVERKGPRLGLLLGGSLVTDDVRAASGAAEIFDAIVGERARVVDTTLADAPFEDEAVRAVGWLAERGANRIVVSFGGADGAAREARLQKRLLRTFPPHLLGALPILHARELAADDVEDVRRTWTALFNAFLHPEMERFLYAAEHKLRDRHATSPLLVFRNDGLSGRVAKTIAIKTYSSGPRGGMEAARALAAHHGLARLVTMDVGGTTTDIGVVERGAVRLSPRGRIEGVETSFPLCDVASVGVGGSSIFRVENGKLRVGPESVGSTPGPACFGLGGTEATITDAFLLAGLLDPVSFFGGDLALDVERARTAVKTRIAEPLGIGEDAAVLAMERAWVAKIVASLPAGVGADTTLAAFGGAGPLVACRIAEEAGISRVVIPGLAAIFSAFGVGFSDTGHHFAAALPDRSNTALAAVMDELRRRADRSMFGEGARDWRADFALVVVDGGATRTVPLATATLPPDLGAGAQVTVTLTAVKEVAHATIGGRFDGEKRPARSTVTRTTLAEKGRQDLPLYRVEEQTAFAAASGPAVLEEAFFTGRIDPGWSFQINDVGDILLRRQTGDGK